MTTFEKILCSVFVIGPLYLGSLVVTHQVISGVFQQFNIPPLYSDSAALFPAVALTLIIWWFFWPEDLRLRDNPDDRPQRPR